jgi:radical SAM superfamily enzyme YgiQ (UPF0313 family)
MNILLLYPEFPDTFWSFKHALKFVGRRATQPPLGLLTVAALLPTNWAKRLIDLNVTQLSPGDLAWADYAFIGGMVVQRESALRLIARCRAAGVPIVAGGPLFTSEPEAFEEVDHLVLNEAEITLPLFLADLERGQARHLYATDKFADLHASPAPLWKLADLRRYSLMGVQYSRGCPFQCEFCNVTTLFGHRPRTKSADQVVAELDGLRRVGWDRPVFFVDDNLIANRRCVREELLPALIKWQRGSPKMPFNTQVSIDLADDPELMRQMAEAGFDTVFIGIETPDEQRLAECGKRQNTHRDLAADVRRIQRAGLQVQGGFIVGFDGDTPSIFQQQIDFIQRSGIVTAMVGMLQAITGTKLYERLQREGRIRGPLTGDNVDGTTNIAPTMGLEALQQGFRQVLNYLYVPKHYYQRIRTLLREYSTPRIQQRPTLQGLAAVARSMLHLGVLGKERLHYWKLLAWTALRRPSLLSHAVSLAICGYHYRKVCEMHIL